MPENENKLARIEINIAENGYEVRAYTDAGERWDSKSWVFSSPKSAISHAKGLLMPKAQAPAAEPAPASE